MTKAELQEKYDELLEEVEELRDFKDEWNGHECDDYEDERDELQREVDKLNNPPEGQLNENILNSFHNQFIGMEKGEEFMVGSTTQGKDVYITLR